MATRPVCAVVAGWTAFWLTLLLAAPAPAGVRARVGGFVHPLLAGLDHAPLIRVELEVEGDPVELQRLEFSLAGSDHLGDLDQVSLFSTGAERGWSAKTPIGTPLPPTELLAFPLAQRLAAGRHVFWLACRVKPGADLSHQVTAHVPKVVLAGQELIPEDDVPARRHRLGVAVRRAGQDGVHTSRIPALARTPQGTLLCVYDLRRRAGRDLQEDIDIGLSRSVDRGQTWEPVRVIMDMGEAGGLPQALNGCSDPGLIVDPQTGEIFCFALWMQGKEGQHQWVGLGSEPGHEVGKSAQLMLVRSRDDGVTWSPPENLTRILKDPAWWLLAPAPQTGIALADGTLVMPMQGRQGQGSLATFATVMSSRDHGKTWTVGTPAAMGGNEPQAAQLSDGSLMLTMRNDRERFRAVAVTTDLGQTWKPHPTSRQTLIEPNCNGSLVRVDCGPGANPRHVLVFANPRSQRGRTHHTLQVSFDDGLTWPAAHRLLLDEERGAGYPSLVQVDDAHVGLVYEGSQAQVVFERIPLERLLRPGTGPAAIEVRNPRTLPAGPIDCERIAVGEADDYKPSLARLPSGELLLAAFHQDKRPGNKVRERVLLFRSRDGGRSWSGPGQPDLLGREPYLTALPDGTLFLTGHLLAQDERNEWGVTCGFVHRSTDGGETWQSLRIPSEGVQPGASNHTSRNVLRLADGTLLLGVDYDGGKGPYQVWKSTDQGASWQPPVACTPRDFKSQYGFFGGETWLWQARSGKIWALVRVDSHELPIRGRPTAPQDDQDDHFILWSSSDGGRTFDRGADLGDYGEMYMSLLRLQDRRLLLTFTVRKRNPPLGVRAVVATETDDGFEVDLTADRLQLDISTGGRPQGGGFGPTVQLDDGTLVTSCSWRGADGRTRLEVIRWRLPEPLAAARE